MLWVNYELILKAREQRAGFGWHMPVSLTLCRVRQEYGLETSRPAQATKQDQCIIRNKTKQKRKQGSCEFYDLFKAEISIKQMWDHRQRYESKDYWIRMFMEEITGDLWGDKI